MAMYVRSGGSWVAKASMAIRSSGGWATKTTAYKRVSGAWVAFLTALSGSNAPSSINYETTSTSASENITSTGSGGTGSYSYSWSLVSNTGGYSLTNASSQTCTVSRSGLVVNATYTCTARCTISDGVSSVNVDTAVSIKRVNPPL
jgi:hypothetical protein